MQNTKFLKVKSHSLKLLIVHHLFTQEKMGRSVTVDDGRQGAHERQQRHRRQSRRSRATHSAQPEQNMYRSSSSLSSSSSPTSYRNYKAAGGGGVKSAHSRNPGQSQQQQQQHHHHHHGGHSAAASSPSYADVEREAERAAEDEASAAAATIEGADSDGTPAGASDATVKLLRQLRHRATELESQLATAGREKERLQLELGEATGG